MNKAFTANINDQVTARGYLDENDQLVMLEPEGSGGGGFTTCEVTFSGRVSDDIVIAPHIYESELNAIIQDSGSYDVVLYNGVCYLAVIDIDVHMRTTVEVSGNAEIAGDGSESDSWYIKVTGDATISISKTNIA